MALLIEILTQNLTKALLQSMSPVTGLNVHTIHNIYVLIYLTVRKNQYPCFEFSELFFLTSFLDLNIRHNI